MSTKAVTVTNTEEGAIVMTWAALAQASSDVGTGVLTGHLQSLSAQAVGTNTNTVAIQGSNDGTNWDAGTTLTIGASGASPVTNITVPKFIRPGTPSAGSNTVVTIVGRTGR